MVDGKEDREMPWWNWGRTWRNEQCKVCFAYVPEVGWCRHHTLQIRKKWITPQIEHLLMHDVKEKEIKIVKKVFVCVIPVIQCFIYARRSLFQLSLSIRIPPDLIFFHPHRDSLHFDVKRRLIPVMKIWWEIRISKCEDEIRYRKKSSNFMIEFWLCMNRRSIRDTTHKSTAIEDHAIIL